MPSPVTTDEEESPTKYKPAGAPRRTSAIKRGSNATPRRKSSANKVITPNSAPVRGKSGSKRPEPTLLGDFLLGRPSPNRVRRRSSDVIKSDVKESAVSRLQSPGGVQDKVKQWQKSNAAATVIDPNSPASEPDEMMVAVDEESVTEEDRMRIKRRLARHERRKCGDKEEPQLDPTNVKVTPKKRVVSDSHWMNKSSDSRPTTQSVTAKPPPEVANIPEDSLKKNSRNSVLESRIEDWATRTSRPDRVREERVRRNSTKVLDDDGIRVRPSRLVAFNDRTRVKPSHDSSLDDGIRVIPGKEHERQRQVVNDEVDVNYSGRRKSDKQVSSSLAFRESRRPSPSSKDVKYDDEEPISARKHKSHRQRSVSPPESLAEIPVGYSAFSVLDIPVGGDASGMRAPKPQRNPSLSSVPRVLKKVYSEGMKIVHDTVDPPRTNVHQPPSIESWLSGTSDPFIDHVPINNHQVEEFRSKPPRHNSEMQDSHCEPGAEVCLDSDQIGTVPRPRHVSKSKPRDRDLSASTKEVRAAVIPTDDTGEYNAQDNRDSNPSSSQTALKRSPATRNLHLKSSPKSSPKSPLCNVLEEAPNGKSESERTKRSPAKSPTQLKVREELPNGSELSFSKRNPNDITLDNSDFQDEAFLRRSPRMPGINSSDVPDLPLPTLNRRLRRDARATRQHRLSTIASGDTFSTASSRTETSTIISHTTVAHSAADTCDTSCTSAKEPSPSRSYDNRSGLKRRLTKHSDLLSVLSMPDTAAAGRSTSIRSARSVRTTRVHLDTATISDLMQELADDEVKYMRELKTLVDGVIPVLLTSALKKSEPANGIGLFNSNLRGHADASMTKPIVEMGIALERMKSIHRRIPLQDSNQLIHWASSAHKIYEDYLTAWRMGFQDVVVNLAPASNAADADSLLDGGMLRNAQGDVVNGDGERVDVAFLLKRPLVRVKYLAKAIKGIRSLKPSQQTEKIDDQFQALLELTRRRIKEEGARQEDQLANNTDSTRARDPRTLAPVEAVKIDRTRQVRAKDYFAFELSHTSGQRLGCEVELLLRDKSKDPGDVLICEVDARKDRWLLFPPIEFDKISARAGNDKKEMVVMIRGIHAGNEWQEVFTLTADDDENASEWLQMLGQTPQPPSLQNCFGLAEPDELLPISSSTDFYMSGGLAPDVMEIPIGERGLGEDSSRPIIHRRQRTANSLLSSAKGCGYIIDDPLVLKSETENIKDDTVVGGNIAFGLKHRKAKPYQLEAIPVKDHDFENDRSLMQESTRDNDGVYVKEPSRHRSHVSDLSVAQLPIRSRDRKDSGSSKIDGRKNFPRQEATRPEVKSEGVPVAPSSNSWGQKGEDGMPAPLHHKSINPPQKKTPLLSSLASKFKNRRSSSPLKHEYQPSERSSESELSDSEAHNSSRSDSSDDEDLEGADSSLSAHGIVRHAKKVSPTGSVYSDANTSLAPSNSASQVPYHGVASQRSPDAVKLVAAISSWSQKGRWDALHPEDCFIVIGPGLIEAFVMRSAHHLTKGNYIETDLCASSDVNANSDTGAEQPLIALVLTPVVPLRQSTALDIEIRSPPLSSSQLKCGDTVRFRTRTVEDCKAMYAAIHRARLDNPKYKQLEQERILSSYGGQSYQGVVGGNRRRTWFGRQKSYRATTRAPSATTSEDSAKSLTSALSALRRLSSGGAFNIEKSTVDTTLGVPLGTRSGAASIYTSSSESGTSGFTPPRTPTSSSTVATGNPNGDVFGHENLKIRLYLLETSSKWAEIGAARLTITNPPACARPISALYQGIQKRIVIKTKPGGKQKLSKRYSISVQENDEPDEVLLDLVLGVQCFSRQGIVGVCMNVWEEIMGDNGEVGMVRTFGGVSGRSRKYMFQCANAAQARWIFALVGHGGR